MKKEKNSAFTLVELIAVVAILPVLLCIAVPSMMNYINAAHEAVAKIETQICVDAVQRYLNDEREKGTLAAPKLPRLTSPDLGNSDSPLKDYISGGQKEARIVSVKVSLSAGHLSCLEYGNRYGIVKLNTDEEGDITEAESQERDYRTEIIWSTVLTVWGWLLDYLLYINLVFSIITIFFQRRDPRSAWTQLLALYSIPVFGIAFYLFFGQDMKKGRMFWVKEVNDRLNLSVKNQEGITRSDDMPEEMMDPMSRDFRSLIIYNLETSDFVLTVNNQVQIYINGQAKFEVLRNALRQARRLIHIQHYIIKNDEPSDFVVPILPDKVREGVEVRILCDGMGGRPMPKKRWDQIRRAGIKIGVFFPPFLGWLNLRVNCRNHREIVVMDGVAGFVGGFNIGREYISRDPKSGYWCDTHLEIKGETATSLQIRSALDWNYVTGENLFKEVRYFGEEAEYARRWLNGQIHAVWSDLEHVSEMVRIQTITSGPDTKEPHIRNNYLELFHKARHRIYIQTLYFVPDDTIFSSLKTVVLSGVDVRLMISYEPDHPFVYWIICSYVGELLDYGARAYAYENGFLHSKGIMADGRVSCYGTASMDIRSFELNLEANATIYDEDVTGQLEEALMNDLFHCREVTRGEYGDGNLRIRIKEQSSRPLSPLL